MRSVLLVSGPSDGKRLDLPDGVRAGMVVLVPHAVRAELVAPDRVSPFRFRHAIYKIKPDDTATFTGWDEEDA